DCTVACDRVVAHDPTVAHDRTVARDRVVAHDPTAARDRVVARNRVVAHAHVIAHNRTITHDRTAVHDRTMRRGRAVTHDSEATHSHVGMLSDAYCLTPTAVCVSPVDSRKTGLASRERCRQGVSGYWMRASTSSAAFCPISYLGRLIVVSEGRKSPESSMSSQPKIATSSGTRKLSS